jgi:hypothetical protein
VDPVPDPLLLRKSGSAGNRTRGIWVSSYELRPLDHRDGHLDINYQGWSSLSILPVSLRNSEVVSWLFTQSFLSHSFQIIVHLSFLYSKLYYFLISWIFTEVTMKNAMSWNVTPCGSCKNRCFRGNYRLYLGRKNRRARSNVSSMLVTANAVPSSPILSPWWGRRYAPPKRLFLQKPRGVTFHETAFFCIIWLLNMRLNKLQIKEKNLNGWVDSADLKRNEDISAFLAGNGAWPGSGGPSPTQGHVATARCETWILWQIWVWILLGK